MFAAYTSCWQAYIDFGTDTNRVFKKAEFDQRLGACLANPEYNGLLDAFSHSRPLGQFFRGPPVEHDPRPVVDISGTTAAVHDCLFDRGETYDIDDGKVLNPASGTRKLNNVSMVSVGGVWKISDVRDGGPCAI